MAPAGFSSSFFAVGLTVDVGRAGTGAAGAAGAAEEAGGAAGGAAEIAAGGAAGAAAATGFARTAPGDGIRSSLSSEVPPFGPRGESGCGGTAPYTPDDRTGSLGGGLKASGELGGGCGAHSLPYPVAARGEPNPAEDLTGASWARRNVSASYRRCEPRTGGLALRGLNPRGGTCGRSIPPGA